MFYLKHLTAHSGKPKGAARARTVTGGKYTKCENKQVLKHAWLLLLPDLQGKERGGRRARTHRLPVSAAKTNVTFLLHMWPLASHSCHPGAGTLRTTRTQSDAAAAEPPPALTSDCIKALRYLQALFEVSLFSVVAVVICDASTAKMSRPYRMAMRSASPNTSGYLGNLACRCSLIWSSSCFDFHLNKVTFLQLLHGAAMSSPARS